MSLERAIEDARLITGRNNSQTEEILLSFWNQEDPHDPGLEKFLAQHSLTNKAIRRKDYENYYLRYGAVEFDPNNPLDRPWNSKFQSASIGEGEYIVVLSYSDVNRPLVESVDLATVSFSAKEDGIIIKQIQGLVKDSDVGEFYTKKLTQLKWDEALVKYCIDIARDLGAKHIDVQGSENQQWLKLTYETIKDDYPHLTFDEFLRMSDSDVLNMFNDYDLEYGVHMLPQQAWRRYDELPMNMGFVPVYEPGSFGNYRFNL